jgi:hypothetical protein
MATAAATAISAVYVYDIRELEGLPQGFSSD